MSQKKRVDELNKNLTGMNYNINMLSTERNDILS